MLPFRLICFGHPGLTTPDGEPVRFRTRKHLALLIYLTVEPPVTHRRERIASLLWPQADTEEARHSLATGLSMLRGCLGPRVFDGTRDTIRLLPGSVDSDVAELMADVGPDLGSIPTAGFLEDFEIPGAVDFGHWVDSQRARILPVIHDRLTRKISQCKRVGNSRLMESIGEQLRRIDPLSEEATRALLEGRAMAGDRIGSLRVFESWRSKLAEELGAAPTPELEQLAERLRRPRSVRSSATPATKVSTYPPQGCPFVGRSKEFASCFDAWIELRKGVGRQMLIVGESGIGKTAFVGRVSASLALDGATIVRVQSHELERELPFGVLVNLLDQLIEFPGAGGTAPDQLAQIARLVSKARTLWPDLPAPSEPTGESFRTQFTVAVLSLIECLTFERPLVLVIDDIHFADTTSVSVLHALMRRTGDLPLMVLFTSAGSSSQLPASVVQLSRPGSAVGVTILELRPLSEAEAHDLLAALLANDPDPGPTVRRALLTGAQGNPMILELLVSDWRRCGAGSLALAPGSMARSVPILHDNGSLSALVSTEIDSLDDDSRAVLNLAAVLGRRLNDLHLYSLVDLTIPRTMRAMTVLTSRRLLRDVGNQLEFKNAIVRSECYDTMATPLRTMLHSAVADALTGEPTGRSHLMDLEVAWHLVRADRIQEAVHYLLTGGEASIQFGAPHEADLALSTGIPGLTGQDRMTAILLHSEALQELGRWEDSLRVLDTDSDPCQPADECWRDALRVIGMRWSRFLSDDELRAGIDRMIAISGSGCPPSIRAKAVAAAIRLLTICRDNGRITRLAECLNDVAAAIHSPFDRLHIALAEAWTLIASDRPAAALECLRAGVDLAVENGFRSSITARLLVGLGNTLSVLGKYREAIDPLVEAEAIAQQLDNRTLAAECSTQLAVAFGRLGERSAQIDWARRAAEGFRGHDRSPGVLGASYELGIGLAMDGRLNEAKAVAADLLTQTPVHETAWIRQAALLCAADILILAGYPKRASRLARAGLLECGEQLLNRSYAGLYARWIAQTSVEDRCPATGLERLAAEFPCTGALHAKDRAELLAAKTYLSHQAGLTVAGDWDRVREEFRALPLGINTAIRVMGLHPDQQRQVAH